MRMPSSYGSEITVGNILSIACKSVWINLLMSLGAALHRRADRDEAILDPMLVRIFESGVRQVGNAPEHVHEKLVPTAPRNSNDES
jgi:hypothetical protein